MKYLLFILLTLTVGIAGLSIYLQPNSLLGCDERPTPVDTCQAADAIVVLSGGDTEARTDKGVALYRNGWAKKIIFSGAARDTSGPSNAATMRDHAIALGVPATAIVTEEDSRTTGENAEKTRTLLAEHDIRSIILVTSGYHQRRASIAFDRLADGLVIANAPVGQDKDWSAWWWLTPRGWWLAGGEMVKIIVTSTRGEAL